MTAFSQMNSIPYHTGPHLETACPLGFERFDQNLNEGGFDATQYVYLCYSYDVSMVWYGMVWYGMVWYGMVWYSSVQISVNRLKAYDNVRVLCLFCEY